MCYDTIYADFRRYLPPRRAFLPPKVQPTSTFAELPPKRREKIDEIGRKMTETDVPPEFRKAVYETAKELKISIKDSVLALMFSLNALASKTPSLQDGEETSAPDEKVYLSKVVFQGDFKNAKKYYDALFNKWLKRMEKNDDPE